MDLDEKDLRERELAELGKGRNDSNRNASRTLWVAVLLQIATIVLALVITRLSTEADRDRYLITQQRSAYQALLVAARAEASTALDIRRKLENEEGSRPQVSDLLPSINRCRRAVLDVKLLGPDSLKDEAKSVGQTCARLNEVLVSRVRDSRDAGTQVSIRKLRADLYQANRDFLTEATTEIGGS